MCCLSYDDDIGQPRATDVFPERCRLALHSAMAPAALWRRSLIPLTCQQLQGSQCTQNGLHMQVLPCAHSARPCWGGCCAALAIGGAFQLRTTLKSWSLSRLVRVPGPGHCCASEFVCRGSSPYCDACSPIHVMKGPLFGMCAPVETYQRCSGACGGLPICTRALISVGGC